MTERALWLKGITCWEDYSRHADEQLLLFGNLQNVLTESIQAFERGDAGFFARRLKASDYYRIALSFPAQTIFLDIETTGLSLYYDQLTMVGWSTGNKFHVYIAGHNADELRLALQSAKVIVTYNGTMFDLKFLRKTFDGIEIPEVHLDLRYFSRRVGLKGGQKAIEKELGFARPDDLVDMVGENAPVLWHRYRRGENQALRTLIRYNHSDIEGMKYILDESIHRFFRKEEIPTEIQPDVSFARDASTIRWARKKPTKQNADKIYIESFKGDTRPLIEYRVLNLIYPLDHFCVVGLDIVSKEEKETGCCVLKGRTAVTSRLHTDDEMIQLIIDSSADLVSIDSPLSLPRGRTSYFDDDPAREEFGITRLCERLLKRRGINSYPCLIQSMQKLTRRGVELADKIRHMGIPVIESYPGAAQDIMSIPRKQAGLKYLTAGLSEFGIQGTFVDQPVSHDELDAITSAIVGHFHWTGMFEGLGDEEEDYLIIPDLNADTESWLNRKVIGLSGKIASGKTTIADYLATKGFADTRYSRVLESMLVADKIEPNRENLQKIGTEVNENQGQRWLGRRALALAGAKSQIVVDGIRFLEDRALLLETFGPSFRHVHVAAPPEVRAARIAGVLSENLSLKATENSETESEIADLEEKADYVVENDSSLDALYEQIDGLLGGD